MPGPKPTPTATLAARGSWRTATRKDEPLPSPLLSPDPPADLPAPAKAHWEKMAPRLISAGILTDADIPTFARYCRVYVAWSMAMAEVEANPCRESVLSLAKLDDMVRRLESVLGLTPSDRTGIRVEKPDAEGKARFFAA